jgi:hypothetical protein
MFYRFLRLAMLILTCGFYTLHVVGYEIPIEPKTPEKIKAEDDENNPGNQNERRQLDQIDPENAPHSEEDRKNWASIE